MAVRAGAACEGKGPMMSKLLQNAVHAGLWELDEGAVGGGETPRQAVAVAGSTQVVSRQDLQLDQRC